MRLYAPARWHPTHIFHDLTLHDLAMAAVLVPALLLAVLPFASLPTDYETTMKVKFSDGTDRETRFSLTTLASVCAEIKLMIADPGPAIGAYTKIKC